MNSAINTLHSTLWIIPIIALTFGAVYFLYYRKFVKENLSKIQVVSLLVIRFLVLLTLGLLLLKPIISKNKSILQKPLVLFAVDNSASMLMNKDSVFVKDSLLSYYELFDEEINEKANLKLLTFGDSIAFNQPTFTSSQTNYEQLFNEFNTTFFNQNIGAIVLVSDGIFNKGLDPKYASKNIAFPIYTLPIGDTIVKSDVSIAKIEHNSVVYKGSKFPVEIGLKANMLENKFVEVEVYKNDTLETYKRQYITSSNYYNKLRFNLNADSSGVFKYEVRISGVDNEANEKNNIKQFFVEVEEDKRKVLIIQNGYHPDVSVFKTIIERNPAFEVELTNPIDISEDLSQYSLIILHQLPSKQYNLQKIFPALKENKTPILFVLANQTNISALNNIGVDFEIEQKKSLFDDVFPFYNSDFNLFNTAISEQFYSEMPPLYVPFGNYSKIPSNQVMFYQQIGSIQSANPLWGFTNNGRQKIAYILGEGLWKWRLQEYRIFNDHSITNELVMKTVQYLASKKKQKTFIVDHLNVYNENQTIEILAKLFNASDELVKNANIELNVFDEQGHTYPHSFKEFESGYEANLGMLKTGKYSFEARTLFGSKTYVENGTFIVNKNEIESINLKANYNMLYQLSEQSNGKLIDKHNLSQLSKEIVGNENIKSIEYSHQTLLDLIDLKAFMVILMFMLVVEWFLRKYWGLV